jgi:molybdopterin-guanine dinucleotide biosynthesis protein B
MRKTGCSCRLKHTGKTTIIENLVRELKSRGNTVGVIKEMVRIPTLDTPQKETDRYRQAGAETVVAVPRTETVLFINKRLSLRDVLPYVFHLDYVLLEGFEKEKAVAKIIAAKTAEDAAEFDDGLAIAVSGPLTETPQSPKSTVPFLSALAQPKKLADLVEQKAFAALPDLPHCGECGYPTCYDQAKALVKGEANSKGCALPKKESVVLEVNGERVPLKEFPQQIIQATIEGMMASLQLVPEIKNLKIEVNKRQA